MTSDDAYSAAPITRLVEEFHRLPGIGPKTAQRLTYYMIRMPEEHARALAEAVLAVKEQVKMCSRCYNITEFDPCRICSDPNRDQATICVVEEALDVLALERTHSYDGIYHVLHGVISPMNGIGPDDLKIEPLLSRLKAGTVQELIVATNPNLEGEATAMYLQRLLSPMGIHLTRPARGLPVGGDIEYADEATLSKAIEGRQTL